MILATRVRASHFWSAGTTYQDASLVLVELSIFSYAFMYLSQVPLSFVSAGLTSIALHAGTYTAMINADIILCAFHLICSLQHSVRKLCLTTTLFSNP